MACLTMLAGDRHAHLSLSDEEAEAYLRATFDLYGGVPDYRWRDDVTSKVLGYVWHQKTDSMPPPASLDPQVLRLLAMHMRRTPTSQWFDRRYGGWVEALTATGILDASTERRSRGITTLAQDGHACASLGELHIDNWLHANEIPHTREPAYPDSDYRADFEVAGIFIEYFGLHGVSDYDQHAAAKKRHAKKHGIKVIAIYPDDLANWPQFQAKLGRSLGYPNVSPGKIASTLEEVQEIFKRHNIDPTSWPNTPHDPRPHPTHDPDVVWESDPFRVAHERARSNDLWTRRIRNSLGIERRHTPGTRRARARHLERLHRDNDEFNEETRIGNAFIDEAELAANENRLPNWREIWELVDAAQNHDLAAAEEYDDPDDPTPINGAMLHHAFRNAYTCAPTAALAIYAELLPTSATLYPHDEAIRASLISHGCTPDPVAAGLATPTTTT